MRADLHIHSVYSDGFYTPDEICRIAKERGLDLLSITDHDSMNGDEEKCVATLSHGLRYLSGWEISAYEGMEKMHILGFGCQKGEGYTAFMQARRDASLRRVEERVQKLQGLGIPVTVEEVVALCTDKTAPVHTMMVARATAKYLPLSLSEIYEKYLAPGALADSDFGRPTPLQAIECIHASGGKAVLAHPGRLTVSDREKMEKIKQLVKCGLDGIEAIYTTHTKKESEDFCALANQLGLFVSGGSDTHVEREGHFIGTPTFFVGEDFLRNLGDKIIEK